MQADYAGAWHAERGRCFRFVYTTEDDGRPMVCPEPVAATGWQRNGNGCWFVVDACERHASQLQKRPVRKTRP